MKRAVQANPDEQIVYSWVIWPDKATCDAASEKMMADERMKPDGTPIPFDMKRMIYAGFDAVMDTGDGGAFGRSEEHTSELQSLMRISYAVFCLKKKNQTLKAQDIKNK